MSTNLILTCMLAMLVCLGEAKSKKRHDSDDYSDYSEKKRDKSSSSDYYDSKETVESFSKEYSDDRVPRPSRVLVLENYEPSTPPPCTTTYLLYSDNRRNRTYADTACNNNNQHLASVENEAALVAVMKAITASDVSASFHNFWTSGVYIKEDNLAWWPPTEKLSTYQSLALNASRQYETRKGCIVVNRSSLLENHDCSEKHYYICQSKTCN